MKKSSKRYLVWINYFFGDTVISTCPQHRFGQDITVISKGVQIQKPYYKPPATIATATTPIIPGIAIANPFDYLRKAILKKTNKI